jgi:hypothetical protein
MKGKVYVLRNEWFRSPKGGTIPYKIGKTTKEINGGRFMDIRTKMPGEYICEFVYEFNDIYSDVEKCLHKLLNKSNIKGEWFELNKETLLGIKIICEMLGGKLDTKDIKDEIKKSYIADKNDKAFEKILKTWNSQSDMKATGQCRGYRNIYIPNVAKGIHYAFALEKPDKIVISIGCWSNKFPGFDKYLKTLDKKNINGYIFKYNHPAPSKENIFGWKGEIKTIIPKNEIDNIIATMNKLINATKENIIKEAAR